MEKTVDEMLAEGLEGNWKGGRKLTFTEKCGAFAALYSGQLNMVVARAFGISPQTVSKLSGCLESDPDPYRSVRLPKDEKDPGSNDDPGRTMQILQDHNRNRSANRHLHYRDVGDEFHALGREEFTQRYYTKRVHARIVEAKEAIRQQRRAVRNKNNSPPPLD